MNILQIHTEIVTTTSDLTSKGALWLGKVIDMVIAYAPKLLGAIIFYIIGRLLIGRFIKIADRVFKKRNFDVSLLKFLISLIYVTLNLLMFLAIAGMLGVNITSFAALLAGAGLAVGAALNGSLGNLAGGVMLMIFKPIKVGDLIEA
jgi:small conductance mechanosensitive channel